jgi:hypothetical protein
MEVKPDFNRFLAAVRHQETDRVPLGEIPDRLLHSEQVSRAQSDG